MNTADGNGVAPEVEDELAVTVDADDVALAPDEDAGEHTQLDMVLGKLLEWGFQECHPLGGVSQAGHEGLHHLVVDGRGPSLAPVVHQMVFGVIAFQKKLEALGSALQKHKAADGGLQLFLHSASLALLPVRERAMDKTGMGGVGVPLVVVSHLFLKNLDCLVVDEQVAPWHTFYT